MRGRGPHGLPVHVLGLEQTVGRGGDVLVIGDINDVAARVDTGLDQACGFSGACDGHEDTGSGAILGPFQKGELLRAPDALVGRLVQGNHGKVAGGDQIGGQHGSDSGLVR